VRLGLRVKLFGGFGGVLTLLLIVAVLGWRNTNTFSGDVKSLYQDSLATTAELDTARSALYELQLGALSHVNADAATRTQIEAATAKWTQQIDASIKSYASGALSSEEQAQLKSFQQGYQSYTQTRAQVLKLDDASQGADASDLLSADGTTSFAKANGALQGLITIQVDEGTQMSKSDAASASTSSALLIGATLLALLLGATVAYLVAQGVVNGVRAVQRTLTSLTNNCVANLEASIAAMADYDLSKKVVPVTQPIDHYGSDEIGQTAAVTNTMLAKLQAAIASYERTRSNLQQLVGSIASSAGDLAETSAQLGLATAQTSEVVQQVAQAVQGIASGAQDTSRAAQTTNDGVEQLGQAIDGIARGATEQAQQVQAASMTVQQMADAALRTAAEAQSVAANSDEARAAAEQGAQAVQQTVTGMSQIRTVVSDAVGKVEELGKLGERIGAVVETIDDIAEQTNLLALNAAIEAARAGEHGRGFAVVADEVRKLAERSQRETKAIAGLITEVQRGTRDAVRAMEQGAGAVETGALQADQAGAALTGILLAVKTTVTQVTGIAQAAQEMASGARNVVEAMENISAVVEQNSAATEEMAAQSAEVGVAVQSISAVAEENSATTQQVSASAEEMGAQVEEMSAQAELLATTAAGLRALVGRFTLGAADNAVAEPAADDTTVVDEASEPELRRVA
jgi:methyl-accepting chemotaxis protein